MITNAIKSNEIKVKKIVPSFDELAKFVYAQDFPTHAIDASNGRAEIQPYGVTMELFSNEQTSFIGYGQMFGICMANNTLVGNHDELPSIVAGNIYLCNVYNDSKKHYVPITNYSSSAINTQYRVNLKLSAGKVNPILLNVTGNTIINANNVFWIDKDSKCYFPETVGDMAVFVRMLKAANSSFK